MRGLLCFFSLFLSLLLWGEEIFYVPGWRTGFDRREGSVKVLHDDFPGLHVTVKSWNSAVSYPEAEKNAEIYAETLKQELLAMPETRRRKLILVGHSLGARIVVEVLDALAKKGIKIHEAALLGAAIDWDDPRIGSVLSAVETRCWNVYSPRDMLLALYPLTQGKKALGQVGWSHRNRRFPEREMTGTKKHFAYLYLEELGRLLRATPPWKDPLKIDPCDLKKVTPSLDKGLYWVERERCGNWLLLAHRTGGEFRIVDPDGMIRAQGKQGVVRREFQKVVEYYSSGAK